MGSDIYFQSESYLYVMATLHLTFYLDLFYASHEGLYMYNVIKNSLTRLNRNFDCIFSDFLSRKFSKRRKRKGEPKLAVITSILALVMVSCFLHNNILIAPRLGGHGFSYLGHCYHKQEVVSPLCITAHLAL